jgi:hypothetical protein
MSSNSNKMTEEEYKYSGFIESQKGLLELGKIRAKKDLFLQNIKDIEKKICDKLEDNYIPFFDNVFKETKFDDAIFYYDEFINFSNKIKKKGNLEEDLLVFPITDKISKESFEHIFFIHILKHKIKKANKEIDDLKVYSNELDDQSNEYLSEIEELELKVKELSKPDPKLVERVVKLREKCKYKNKKEKYYLYFICFLFYVIYSTPKVVFDEIYYLLSNLMLIIYFTLNFMFDLSCELFNITLNFAVKSPFEFTLFLSSFATIFFLVRCLIKKEKNRKKLAKNKSETGKQKKE